MTLEIWLTLCVVLGCLGCLFLSKWPPEHILITGVVILMFTDVISVSDALAGFSNEGMVTVAILYLVAGGLSQTGAVSWMSQFLLGSPRSVVVAQLRLMFPVATMSSLLNNTPVVAMLIPAVGDWSKRYRLSISQLMIPLSYAAIIGGCCTIVGTSTNLVINGMLIQHDGTDGLSLFELAWIGVPLVLVVILYVVSLSRWILPHRFDSVQRFEDTRQYVIEMIVEPLSAIAGKSIEEAGLRNLPGVFLVEIQRSSRVMPVVQPTDILCADDRLVFAGDVASMVDLKRIPGLRSAEDQVFKLENRDDRCLVEVAISPQYPFLNSTIKESNFRTYYGAVIIAVSREGERIKQRIGDIKLRPGDTLLMEAHSEFVTQQRYAKDFLLVSEVEGSAPIKHEKRAISLVFLVAMVVLVSAGLMSMLEASIAAAAAMIVTRCVNIRDARHLIKWDVLLVIAASIGLGTAMEKSGTAALIADSLIQLVGDSPTMLLIIIFTLTAGFSAVISNLAAAVLVFPIALASSEQLGVSMVPLAVTLMIAASASFATPIGYQTNLMVYGPGNYKFIDFVRAGLPLTVLVGVVTVSLVPLIWPF